MTLAEFKAWFPGGQFAAVTEISGYLTRATPHFNVDRWGGWYAEGLANWVAHSIVVDRAEATQSIDEVDADDGIVDSIGPITSRRSSENVELMAKNPYMRTTYGRRYRYLARMVGMGGAVA